MDSKGLFRVDGMVAVVTGGGTGIGLTITKALVGAGASKVYILGRRRDVLEAAASSNPAAIVPVVCDVGSKASLQAAADAVAQDTGYVNLVVANSGLGGVMARWHPSSSVAEVRRRLFDGVAMEDFTQTFHVNVTGAYFTMLAFLELLDAGNRNALKGGFGAPLAPGGDVPSIQSQVLFTSSISAYSRMWMSNPSYSGSKAAIAHLTKHASTNMVRYGIRANALAPGIFPSELATALMGDRDPGKETPDDDQYIPARRFGGDEEMAGTILYVASRAGAFCNGLILVTDGGKLSTMPSDY
ncbi:short chain dehydrogenase [Biscogniauxia mediterranea]|nr:short chain dehydrogenase [Biscogniauxia mediterranea]